MLTCRQYIHDRPKSAPKRYLFSYLSQDHPTETFAIGTSPTLPPTPESFTENHAFLDLVQTVIREHAHSDPDVQAQAAMYQSQAGSALGSGGMFFPQSQTQRNKTRVNKKSGDGAGGASSQGGMGGAGRGGWIHVADQRNPPDFGRVAWPEDIFGSLELDGEGKFVNGDGNYQVAGTYRVVTREGFFGLSGYLREKVVQRLRELEEQARRNT
nr:hypothetical protein CFP56_21266 [Quercus suber]